MSLVGKGFVVTGGASGIGLAVVRKLLQLSATVHAIDKAGTFPTQQNNSGKLWVYPAIDVASRASVSQAFKEITNRTPRLTGLVNCAGIVRQHASSTTDDDVFKQVLDVNLGGTWNVSTEFVRTVEAAKKGAESTKEADTSIVNIGSMASFRGIPGIPGYVASKHAVHGLTKAWAQEWGHLGIRVNLIGPGMVRTAMTQDGADADPNSMVTFPTALKPYAEPEEIASTVVFLLGDASSYVTGQGIEVNGGWL